MNLIVQNRNVAMMLAAFALVACATPDREVGIGVQEQEPGEYMFVGGKGRKEWYSSKEIEQIARRYASEKNLQFGFENTEKMVWIKTDGGKVLADVFYSSGIGKPVLHISIDKQGRVIKHDIAIGICGTGRK